jgi:hypothetical protein
MIPSPDSAGKKVMLRLGAGSVVFLPPSDHVDVAFRTRKSPTPGTLSDM